MAIKSHQSTGQQQSQVQKSPFAIKEKIIPNNPSEFIMQII